MSDAFEELAAQMPLTGLAAELDATSEDLREHLTVLNGAINEATGEPMPEVGHPAPLMLAIAAKVLREIEESGYQWPGVNMEEAP